eukprot:TRINITY_DN0_c119_g1_i1.p1 TRINITY_DN0_c119_g1~~TRINITY_DN0_c119_g1_i1.p1  ORF type:complete len:118 (-),score=20.60 TRINITY_DN0_c119_g1_i1:110-463(-)
MVVEVMKTTEEATYLRPYVECAKSIAFEKYDHLEEYSPLAFGLLQQTLTTAKDLTPKFVQDKVTEYAGTLDDIVDASDGLLTSAWKRQKIFQSCWTRLKASSRLKNFGFYFLKWETT